MGMLESRSLKWPATEPCDLHRSGDMQDIYAGDFLVVGLTEDDFGSLTSEQMQKFEEQFHQPQMFVRMGRSIMAIPVPDDMVKKMEEKVAKPQEKSKPAPDRDSL